MSSVCLIAADKPLPLCSKQSERTSVTNGITISLMRGFRVDEHLYYRHAVDMLGYPIKPCQYELELEVCEDDLVSLHAYLAENFAAGETVELWHLWLGDDRSGPPPHFCGTLDAFDLDTLEQFLHPSARNGQPGQCRMTITI